MKCVQSKFTNSSHHMSHAELYQPQPQCWIHVGKCRTDILPSCGKPFCVRRVFNKWFLRPFIFFIKVHLMQILSSHSFRCTLSSILKAKQKRNENEMHANYEQTQQAYVPIKSPVTSSRFSLRGAQSRHVRLYQQQYWIPVGKCRTSILPSYGTPYCVLQELRGC